MNRQVTFIAASCLLFVLLQACSDSNISNNPWQTPATLKSTANISASKATSNEQGDFIIVWQEQEEQQRVNQALTDAHDPDIPYLITDLIASGRQVPLRNNNGDAIVIGGILQTENYDSSILAHRAYFKEIDYADHEAHTHMDIYQRTNVLARTFDANAGAWQAEVLLQTGYWTKTQTGERYSENGDQFRLTGNVGQAFNTQTAVATQTNGDAIAAWVQLDESSTAGEALTTYAVNVRHYTAANKTWSATENVTVNQNLVLTDLSLSLDNAGNAQLLWIARNSTSLITNVYVSSYDGATWAAEQLLSDGNTSAHSVQIKRFSANSGVAVWLQENPDASVEYRGAGDSPCVDTPELCNNTQANLFAQWFDEAGWKSDPAVLVSNGLGLIGDYKLASNNNGAVWAVWEQQPIYFRNNARTVDRIPQIWASQFDTAAAIPAWNAAVRLQADDSATRVDESEQKASQPDLAIDNSGNVMAVWIQESVYQRLDDETTNTIWNNNIRQTVWVNTFSASDDVWSMGKLLNSDERFSNQAPKVIATEAQNFTAMWLRWSSLNQPQGYNLISVDYSSASNSAGSVFNVNERADQIKQFYLALDSNNQVKVVWTGEAMALRYSARDTGMQ